jgi:hypothetical protein
VLNPRRPLLAAATAIILLGLAGTGASAAAVPNRAGVEKPGVGRGGIRYADPDFPFRFAKPGGRLVRLDSLKKRKARASKLKSFSVKTKAKAPKTGETRYWAGLDFINEALYPKLFELRGVGKKIEVWVAVGPSEFAGVESDGTDFMADDCRNGVRTAISDDDVNDLIREFDKNIYPRESAVFSVPEPHDGANALVGEPFVPQGAGDKTVVLVDNIRDEQFFDFDNSQDFGYVVGVFSSALDELFDRNMMTIDAFDWLHRSGARPKNQPSGDNCTDAPAYPRLMEGVFAHEYQHLLEHFADSDETDWVDEGLAEWARTLTGYVDPSLPVSRIGFDKHIQCFLGNDVGDDAGPENSLTLFGDAWNVNCDYGAVYTFMEYLQGRFGTRVMTALHRGQANGLAGVQEALGRRADVLDVMHDWAASMALDDALGRFGWHDWDLWQFRAPTLDASVNWDSPSAWGLPGAAPNGSDYVRLRDGRGRYLSARDLRRLSFDGDKTLEPLPLEWTVDAEPPAGGGAALYSGNDNNLDRMLIRPLSVPAAGGQLGFQAQWNLEEDAFGGWDFAFVQVSTDGGTSYSSIPCTSSRDDASPFSRPVMQENVPGYTAYSGGWRNESCSLNAYAGKSILLAFRVVTDGSVSGDPDDPDATIPAGFWLRGVTFAGSPVASGTTLDGWLSPTEVRPTPVYGFTVQLVAYSSRGHGHVSHATLRLNSQFDASLNERQLDRLVDSKADVVAAIVTYDEPTERVVQWARYRLTANGTLQPGG